MLFDAEGTDGPPPIVGPVGSIGSLAPVVVVVDGMFLLLVLLRRAVGKGEHIGAEERDGTLNYN